MYDNIIIIVFLQNAEFIPGTFYSNLEEMTIPPKEPSPTHMPLMGHPQMTHGQLSHAQMPVQIPNQVHQVGWFFIKLLVLL